MTHHAWAAALLAGLFAGPALASPCSERIEALSGKVRDEGRQAIAAGSSGQADAAARGAQGRTGASADKSADAGKGADKAQAAKVALDEARTLDGKGDAQGCEAAVARAKASLSDAP